jgi:hypothetical protein
MLHAGNRGDCIPITDSFGNELYRLDIDEAKKILNELSIAISKIEFYNQYSEQQQEEYAETNKYL